ncbi:RNA polymerase subunit sigma-70 [Dactylosporangium sp. NPDC049140]|uniref:RNA polymerase subunit sigma-70 n=1 Tax=Dactylosporangium sp. NPDC049140 TaxID=3155647 RepID=UPI00340178EA
MSLEVETVRTLDEASFAELVGRHRGELQVHCYRMVGSFEDAEDLVQETFLRAWRGRETFQGRSSLRAWLYRIATNAGLDFLERHPRQPRPRAPQADGAGGSPDDLPWLQPYPDRLLDLAAPAEAEPDAAVVAKETIELAFMVAIQHLPPRQRAVVILRDVLGWPAADTAGLLELSVAAANSALQRGRATLKEHLPPRRLEWGAADDPTRAERALLQRYMAVLDHADIGPAMAELLHEDVRVTMPPHPYYYVGREPYIASLLPLLDPASPEYFGQWRSVATRANRQPAIAHYVRRPGDTEFRPQVLDVLRVVDGRIAEITSFVPALFAAFGLPATV